MHWYNTRIMDRYITQQLEDRFVVQMNESQISKKNKSIIDLALNTYLQEIASRKWKNSAANIIDPASKSLITGQIKVFLFSGHDTTSSSMCYVFHNLSEHPSELRRLRAEHDAIFTTDIAAAPSLISKDPHLINKLPFTLAVIKETLRLFPAASSTRAGETGYSVVSEDGKSYPTDGCLVYSNHEAIQRDQNFWPSADSFIPDRWLAQPGDPMYPVKGAWRPFEFGPRNCIGQELVMLEMKITMVMTAREFNIRSVYEEWDQIRPRRGPRKVAGERAYQIYSGGPSDGLPCRVESTTAR